MRRPAFAGILSIALAVGCGSAGGSPAGLGEQAGGGSDGSGANGSGANGSGANGTGGSGNFVGGGGTSANQGGMGTGGGLDLGGSGGADPSCPSNTYGGQLVPLDMVILLDRSGSMADNNKWGNITGAINQFCSLPSAAGIGVGLQFFPLPSKNGSGSPFCMTDADCGSAGPCMNFGGIGFCSGDTVDDCSYQDYENLAVPIMPLPGNASAIQTKISGTGPNGGTPTTEALQGVLNYALMWGTMHPDHTTLVVLATDGEPMGCNSDISSAAMFAMQGVTLANPQIKTFVIGVGDSLQNLDTIAMAGGTDKALIVDATANAAQQFSDALDKIRGSVSCDFQLPPPPTNGDMVDFGHVNVTYTTPDGTQTTLYNVGDPSMCGTMGGWYYDNPQMPTRISLCDATCAGVKQNAMSTNMSGSISVVVSCHPTMVMH